MSTRSRASLALAGLCILTAAASAQSWVKQAPLPTETDLNGVAFVSPTHGFITGAAHKLLETTDGGLNWRPVDLGTSTEPFYEIYFRDANNGFLIGNTSGASEHFRTTNGGATWTRMTVPGGSWYHIDSVSATTGFAGANGAIARTTDGGVNWTVRSGYPGCPVVFGMDFKDANVGLVGGQIAQTSTPGIFKTTDGGVSWTRAFTQSANDVLWINGTTAIAIVGTRIYRSINTGSRWSLYSTTDISTGLMDMTVVDTNTIVGVSGAGDVWRSVDNGLTWTQQLKGLGALPAEWCVSFSDTQNGWIAGQGGLVFKTTDGGVTWTQASNGIGAQFYKIVMVDDNQGYAAGENGYVAHTLDGGRRWDITKVGVTGQVFGREESLRSVCTVGSTFAAVAGPGGTVFKTENAGVTWQNIGYPNLPEAFFIEDVKFVSRTEGWLVGLDEDLGHHRTAYHTIDGGNTWTLMPDGGGRMVSVDFSDPSQGIILFAGGRMYRTQDGGATWADVWLDPRFTSPLVDEIKFYNKNIAWIVGWDGIVAKSIDGGKTWKYQPVGNDGAHFFSIAIENKDTVTVCGRLQDMSPIAYRTTDGGAHWSQVPTMGEDFQWFVGMDARPGGTLFGVGQNVIARFDRTPQTQPSTLTVYKGTTIGGTKTELASTDDRYLILQNKLTEPTNASPLQIIAEATVPTATPSGLSLTMEASTPLGSVSQKVEMFNFQTGLFESLGSSQTQITDWAHTYRAYGSLARFVEPGTGKIRARVTWRAPSGSQPAQWTTKLDQLFWQVAP
ncbi:MAG: YCF48-related protein [Fimbriimonas sp.]